MKLLKSKSYDALQRYLKVRKIPANKKWVNCYGDTPNSVMELIRLIRYFHLTKPTVIKFRSAETSFLFTAFPENEISKALYVTGTYEPETIAFLSKNLRKTDIVFDVGANVGIYSLYCSTLCKKIFSFEPSSREYLRLIKNISLNGFCNIKPIKQALSDKERIMRLRIAHDYNSGHNTLCNDFIYNVKLVDIEKVKSTTIDLFVLAKRIKKIDIIKMDVENCELEVLNGALRLLRIAPPRLIIFEIQPEDISRRHVFVSKLLVSLNYKLFYISPDGNLTTDKIYESGNIVAKYNA